MLGRSRIRRQTGDTIIEVLLAITIFSLIAVGALLLMQKGSAMAQRSLEVTLVRQQIDAQADLIRLAHHAHVSDSTNAAGPGRVWRDITAAAQTSGSLASLDNPASCPTNVPGSFVVAKASSAADGLTLHRFATARPATVYSRVNVTETGIANPAEGLWVQAVRIPPRGSATAVDAYDVYVRACWSSVGLNRPMTLGTIVRLYEPRS